MNKKWFVSSAACLMLTACSGGGGGGGGVSEPATPRAEPNYVPFTVSPTLGGNPAAIKVVNLSTPGAAPIDVDADSGGLAMDNGVAWFPSGTISYPARTVSNFAWHTAFYNKTATGGLYRFGIGTGASPTPQRVSSEATAATICDSESFGYLQAGVADKYFSYRLPGQNGNCGDGDDVYRMVRLDMTSATPPYSFGGPIVSDLPNGTYTNVDGWLVHEGSDLVRYNATFDPPSRQVVIGGVTSVLLLDHTRDRRPILIVNNAVRVYNPALNELAAAIHTFTVLHPFSTSSYRFSQADSQNAYFQDGNSVYRLSLSTPAAPTLVVNDIGMPASRNDIFWLSANRVVYKATNGNLHSIPKTATGGTSSTPLVTIAAGEDIHWFTAGTMVYWELTDWDAVASRYDRVDSGVVAENNAGAVTFANSWLAGMTTPRDYSADAADYFDRIILVGFDLTTQSSAGQAVRALTGSTGAVLGQIATVPAGVTRFYPGAAGFGNELAAFGLQWTGSAYQYDMFLLDTDLPGSLQRLTDTAGATEWMLN